MAFLKHVSEQRMTIQRTENVGIVVEDLAAATAFFDPAPAGFGALGRFDRSHRSRRPHSSNATAS